MLVNSSGLSDFTHLGSRLATYAGNVLLRRLSSIEMYTKGAANVERIDLILNALLAQIPDEIPLSNDLVAEGGFYSAPVVVPGDKVKVDFDFTVHDSQHRNTRPNLANFCDTPQMKQY